MRNQLISSDYILLNVFPISSDDILLIFLVSRATRHLLRRRVLIYMLGASNVASFIHNVLEHHVDNRMNSDWIDMVLIYMLGE